MWKRRLLSIQDSVEFSLKPSLQCPYIKEQFFPVGKSRCSRINAFICSLIRKKLIIPLLSPGELHYFLVVLFITAMFCSLPMLAVFADADQNCRNYVWKVIATFKVTVTQHERKKHRFFLMKLKYYYLHILYDWIFFKVTGLFFLFFTIVFWQYLVCNPYNAFLGSSRQTRTITHSWSKLSSTISQW